MKKKNKKKVKKEHKRGYNMLNTPDSVYSRQMSNKKALGAKEIGKMMDFDGKDEQPYDSNPLNKPPMRMMDIVLQNWEKDLEDDDEEDKK
jgi:hypothetical protein